MAQILTIKKIIMEHKLMDAVQKCFYYISFVVYNKKNLFWHWQTSYVNYHVIKYSQQFYLFEFNSTNLSTEVKNDLIVINKFSLKKSQHPFFISFLAELFKKLLQISKTLKKRVSWSLLLDVWKLLKKLF